jgi:PAS domain S-box-containing protein
MEIVLDHEDLPCALVIYDSEGMVIKANAAARDILGATSENLIGSRAADPGWFVTDGTGWPDAENLHPALAAIRTERPQRGIAVRAIRPDGTEVWIQVDAVPVMSLTGCVTHVAMTLTDVTRITRSARFRQPAYGDAAVAAVDEQLASSRLEPEAILKGVTSTLNKLRPGTWVAALINKDPRTVKVVVANDTNPEITDYIEDMQLSGRVPSSPVSMGIFESGQPLLIPTVAYEKFIDTLSPDLRDYLARNPPPMDPVQHMGVLAVAMRARGAVVGMLGLFERCSSEQLSERDIPWLQTIADRTGLATENAQLQMDAVHRVDRLTAMRTAGLAIASSPELRLTLQVILDQTVAGLGVDAACILRVDDSDGLLDLLTYTGFLSTSLPDYRLSVDEVMPVQPKGRTRIETLAVQGALTHVRRRSLFAREGFRAYGAVRLATRGKLVGVLEIFHRSQLTPDQEWIDFLDTLGSAAATAIDYSELCARHQEDQLEGSKPRSPAPHLSRVDRQILGYVVEGFTNREIAEKVHLSHHTIKFHLRQIFDKLKVSNRTELARKATQEGWL